ncbi:MAG: hypothetical protein JXC32_03405, partial [Anaerolineae bacterium]|nr:hypothetical protein [Anaerolineae bacterium]
LRLQELIKGDWWFPETALVLDAQARLKLRAPEGEYRLTLDDRAVAFTLDKSVPEVTVTF